MAPLRPFASLLRAKRLRMGLTQEELADRAGLSVRGISNLERGVRRFPRMHTVRGLAEALELTTGERDEFFGAARRAASALAAPDKPRLVGRTAELARLERHLAGDLASVLLVTGEPGIGKSSLLKQTARAAAARGLVTLEAGCHRGGGQEPYAPFPDLLARFLERQPPSAARRLLEDHPRIARVVRELPDLFPGPTQASSSPEQERRLLIADVQHLLGDIGGASGVALLLDDLHWASAETFELLGSLVLDPQIRIVVAYRDTEVDADHPLALAIGALAEQQRATPLVLEPLSPSDAAELLDDLMDEEADERHKKAILRRAGGIPFFLVSCARAEGESGSAVPWNVAESVRNRVASLAAGPREALEAAAVAGRVVSRSLLTAMLDRPEARVLEDLDETLRVRLLVLEGRAYRFAHDIVREVVEADVGPGRKIVLHLRAAESLVASVRGGPQSAARIAWHFLEGDAPGAALPWALRAGDRAADVFALGDAERHYRVALEAARALGDSEQSAIAQEKLGGVLVTIARYEEALELLSQAAAYRRRARQLGAEARAVVLLGKLHELRGTPTEGIAAIEPLLARRDELEPETVARLLVPLGQLYRLSGRYDDYLGMAVTAGEIAAAVGDQAALLAAEDRRGHALTLLGRLAEARSTLTGALEQAERLGDMELLLSLLTSLASNFEFSGEFREARKWWRRALGVAERLGDPATTALMLANEGWVDVQLGDWQAGHETLARAVSIVESVDAFRFTPHIYSRFADLCFRRGDRETAARYMDKAISTGTRQLAERSDLLLELALETTQAEWELTRGAPEAAVRRLTPLAHASASYHGSEVLTTLAWAQLALGNVAEAEELAARAERAAGASDSARKHAEQLLVRGLARACLGRWADAEPMLAKAHELARRIETPYLEGRVLQGLAWIHDWRGEHDAGRVSLKEATAIFERLGIRPPPLDVVSPLRS